MIVSQRSSLLALRPGIPLGVRVFDFSRDIEELNVPTGITDKDTRHHGLDVVHCKLKYRRSHRRPAGSLHFLILAVTPATGSTFFNGRTCFFFLAIMSTSWSSCFNLFDLDNAFHLLSYKSAE